MSPTAASSSQAHEPPQGGFALLEVVVAAVVLMVILVPTAYLMSSSGALLTANRSRTVAVDLASSQLEEDRSVADSETWATSPFAPSLPSPTSPQTVGDTRYTATQTKGWCQESTAGDWGNYSDSAPPTNPPAAYGILVTVSWQGGSVSAATTLMTPVSQLSSVPDTSSNSCPL